MTRNISLTIEGKVYSITVSDDQKALLAAAAAGRAVLGLWDPEKPEEMPWGVPYLAEKGQETDRDLLERVVRRHAGLPWIIGEGRRLWLRELKEEDWIFIQEFSQERDCPPAFSNKEAFLSYIHSQYRFYEYGLWGVIHRQKDVLLGRCRNLGILKRAVWKRDIGSESLFGGKGMARRQRKSFWIMLPGIFRDQFGRQYGKKTFPPAGWPRSWGL